MPRPLLLPLLTLLAACPSPRTGANPATGEPAGGDSSAVLPVGCGRPAPASGLFAFDHGGVSRSYALQLPSSYDRNTPTSVVFAFHGWGGTEREYLGSSVVTSESDGRGYILVAPRGLGSGAPDGSLNSWSFRGSTTGLDGDGVDPGVPGDDAAICAADQTADHRYDSCAGVAVNGCSWTQCQDDDVDFVLALLDALEAELCIDPRRVFATGGSNGGMFTWNLAQDERSAPRIRAIAPLIGLPHRGYLQAQGRAGDLPVLSITGTLDRTVPPGEWDDPSFTTSSDGGSVLLLGRHGDQPRVRGGARLRGVR